MKKYLSMMMIAFVTMLAFAACSNNDDNGDGDQLELPNPEEKTQTAYADEDSGGFTFTARATWTATVLEGTSTRAESVPWLRLTHNGRETYSGGAGTFTLAIEMDVNYTGQTRSATITIQSGNDRITISVTQNSVTESGEKPVDPKPVTAIALNETALKMVIGNKQTLTATITPADATIKDLVWSSSNEAVATVVNGEITALATGTANITVTSSVYTDIIATCQVVVTDGSTPAVRLISKVTMSSSYEKENTIIEFMYDENNRIKEVYNPNFDGPNTEARYVYEYSSDALVITNNYINAISPGIGRYDIKLNADGYATSMYSKYEDEDTNEETEAKLEYNDGFLWKTSHIYLKGGNDESYLNREYKSTCTWDEQGNMTGIDSEIWQDGKLENSNQQLAQYTNYPNNLSIDLNLMTGDMYLYGIYEAPAMDMYGKRSANLISRYETTGDGITNEIITYEYIFEGDLLIKVISTNDNGGFYTYEFTYQ